MAIWQTADRDGRTVTLTKAGWAHILGKRQDMAGREADVRAAVEAPDVMNRDADHADRETHYRLGSDGLYVKVCVAYDGRGAGIVITAYPTHRIKRREQPRWPSVTR
jgi:hypothetical protein